VRRRKLSWLSRKPPPPKAKSAYSCDICQQRLVFLSHCECSSVRPIPGSRFSRKQTSNFWRKVVTELVYANLDRSRGARQPCVAVFSAVTRELGRFSSNKVYKQPFVRHDYSVREHRGWKLTRKVNIVSFQKHTYFQTQRIRT
jgi:hypothetical protein